MDEPCFREGSKSKRSLGMRSGSLSRRMRRIITDFGSDHPFEQAAAKILEHYRLEVPRERVRCVCLAEAKRVAEQSVPSVRTLKASGADYVVAEADGTMLPIVETCHAPVGSDRRKHRSVRWVEAKLMAARAKGSAQTSYQATLDGVEEAGKKWSIAAAQAGWGADSVIHPIGDGAPWIADQAQQQFGSRSHGYLLDLFHACDYLASAAKAIPGASLEQHRHMLLEGESAKLITLLENHCEPETKEDELAPVRCAHRYLSNRRDQLNYPRALELGLPVGSGLIESGHRHVLQSRLKRAGSWWSPESLHCMTQLRIAKANGQWNELWKN